MRPALSTNNRKKGAIVIVAIAFIIAVAYIATTSQRELYVIDETRTLEVFTAYGSFSGVAVGPHLILTVAHGADLPGDITVNHYRVFKVWSDKDSDLALLRTDETIYLYSELVPGYPLMPVKGRELVPGDSGTAIINKAGAVCYLLQGYDHTAGRYVYKPVTKEAVEAVRIASG